MNQNSLVLLQKLETQNLESSKSRKTQKYRKLKISNGSKFRKTQNLEKLKISKLKISKFRISKNSKISKAQNLEWVKISKAQKLEKLKNLENSKSRKIQKSRKLKISKLKFYNATWAILRTAFVSKSLLATIHISGSKILNQLYKLWILSSSNKISYFFM
jgi:hypothetical protein